MFSNLEGHALHQGKHFHDFGGSVRLPLLALTSEKKAEVEQLLENIRN